MPAPLLCQSCAGRVVVPADHSRAKIRCTACGYYVEIPEEHRQHGAVEARAVAVATPAKGKKKLDAPPLIAGSQDEDNERPYTVPGDAIKKCTACYKELPLDATFCVHCGIDFGSGKKARKSYELIDRSWEPRWNREIRLKVFAGLQVINIVLAFVGFGDAGISGALIFIAIQGALQAFLLGSYETLTVQRTGKGAATLWRTWRIAFIPRPAQKIEWKTSQGVGIIAVHQPGLIEWFTMINLMIPTLVPGLLFYWYVIRPDRFHVSLCDVYGSTNDIAFRTTDRGQAEEICRTIHDATGLWYKPVL